LSEHDVEPATRKAVEAMAARRIARSGTPELAKAPREVIDITKDEYAREVIDMTKDEYGMDALSESEMNEIMAQFEQAQQQKSTPALKQTKLDFSRGTIKPAGSSTSMQRTSSLPSKTAFPPVKPAQTTWSSGFGQPRTDFRVKDFRMRPAALPTVKKSHRAPVAPPPTDAFGRPLAPTTSPELPRPPPKNVYESSSSESSSDEEGGGLFSIARENKSPPKVRQVAKRQVQLLGDPVPSRMALQAKDRQFGRIQSDRNLRARLVPDLTDLLKRVLSWTPSHDGPFPPGKSAQDFKRVEPTFASPQKYQDVFEPLLILECWQHIQQAKMEGTEESFEFVIDNRRKIDEYVELFVSMKPLEYNRVELRDPDLVIISSMRGNGGKECFAKVQGMKRKKESVELVLRCVPASEPASILVPKATLHGVKLLKYHIRWSN
jgi:hypothetical protein